MLRQSHAAQVFLVLKILLAGIESLLKSLRSQASVIPLVPSSNNGGLVVDLEHTVQWASVLGPAVARLFVFLESSRTPHNRAVVLSDDRIHILHATI